jgi:hypothetical protein
MDHHIGLKIPDRGGDDCSVPDIRDLVFKGRGEGQLFKE